MSQDEESARESWARIAARHLVDGALAASERIRSPCFVRSRVERSGTCQTPMTSSRTCGIFSSLVISRLRVTTSLRGPNEWPNENARLKTGASRQPRNLSVARPPCWSRIERRASHRNRSDRRRQWRRFLARRADDAGTSNRLRDGGGRHRLRCFLQ
jgi:hypothetical protein